jgi:acyl-CoA synthetase (AMP-forming)/AMP-acid ligase II
MNIAGILHDRALQHPDCPAIVEPRRAITFSQLDRAASAAAADLAAAGLGPGMRAVVLSPMSIDLYTTVIGMFRLRVTAVFLDPSAGLKRLAGCIARLRPDAFVAVPRGHVLRLLSPAVRSLRIKLAIGGPVPGTRTVATRMVDEADPVDDCGDGTPAIVTFTSGSTGEPKAAVRTHGFLVAQHAALVESLALAPGEIDLTTLPIFLLANLASGVTSVIPDADLRRPGAVDAEPLVRQIRSARPTRTVASPALLARLTSHASAHGQRLDSLRRIFTGGAPVFPKALDGIAGVAPDADVVAVYGSTEAEPIAKIDRRDIRQVDRAAMQSGAGLLAGVPAASIQLRILPDRWGRALGPWEAGELDRQALASGDPGEIVVSGSHVLTGYLDGVGDEETKIRVGDRVWHRTGDAGYLDEQGRLWLLGRCAAKVLDTTGVVYPFAVECAASEVPGVRRTAFVTHGERRLLVAELEEHAPASVRRLLRERVDWARVADVLIVPSIPVDTRHNAKVDYRELEKLLDRIGP